MELVGVEFELAWTKGSRWRWQLTSDEVVLPLMSVDTLLSREDPYAVVVSLNAHRRHLTAEQKRGVISTLLKATPEKSDRQIADTAKVSHHTVAAVRAEQEGRGQIAHVDMRTDTKGRQQPASKPPKSRSDLVAQVNAFQRELVTFTQAYENRLRQWVQEHPELDEGARDALLNGLAVADHRLNTLAQTIAGREVDIRDMLPVIEFEETRP
jgi:hypothetical protein